MAVSLNDLGFPLKSPITGVADGSGVGLDVGLGAGVDDGSGDGADVAPGAGVEEGLEVDDGVAFGDGVEVEDGVGVNEGTESSSWVPPHEAKVSIAIIKNIASKDLFITFTSLTNIFNYNTI